MTEGKNKTYLTKHKRDIKGWCDILKEYAKDKGLNSEDLLLGFSHGSLRMEITDRNDGEVLYDEEIK